MRILQQVAWIVARPTGNMLEGHARQEFWSTKTHQKVKFGLPLEAFSPLTLHGRMTSFTLQLVLPQGKSSVLMGRGCVGRRPVLGVSREDKSLPLPKSNPSHPARSQTLYPVIPPHAICIHIFSYCSINRNNKNRHNIKKTGVTKKNEVELSTSMADQLFSHWQKIMAVSVCRVFIITKIPY